MFFSPSPPSFLYLPRYFFAIFSFTSFLRCSWSLCEPHVVSFSLPPPLSFCLSHMRTCDGATTLMDEKGLELYDFSDLFDYIEASEENCCTEGKGLLSVVSHLGRCSSPIGLRLCMGPPTGPVRPIDQPIGVDSWYLGYISATHQSPLVTGSTTLESSCQPQILPLC